MGRHYEASLTPRGADPGDPKIPLGANIDQARIKTALDGAPHTEIEITTTPKERFDEDDWKNGKHPGTTLTPDDIPEDGKGGIPPIAPPKPVDKLGRSCGKVTFEEWNNEHGDVLFDSAGNPTGELVLSLSSTIERSEMEIHGPLVTHHWNLKSDAYITLNRVVDEKRWTGSNDKEIILDIIVDHADEFWAAQDITPTGTVFPVCELGGCTVANALSFVAAASGAVWYVNETGQLVYHAADAIKNGVPVSTSPPSVAKGEAEKEGWMPNTRAEPTPSPDAVEDGHEKPNVNKDTAKLEESQAEVVNSIKIIGGGEPVERVETYPGNGLTDEFHQSYPVENNDISCTIKVGEITTPVALFEARRETPDVAEYGEYSAKDKNIVFNFVPDVGDIVTVTYMYLAPKEVIVENLDSQADFGKYERLMVIPYLRDVSQFQILAEQLVTDYAEPIWRAEVEVSNGHDYKVGQQAYVYFRELGFSQPLIINERKFTIPLKAEGKIRATTLNLGAPKADLNDIVANISTRLKAAEYGNAYRSDVDTIVTGSGLGCGGDRIGEACIGIGRIA